MHPSRCLPEGANNDKSRDVPEIKMKRMTSRSWSEADLQELADFIAAGGSPARAAVRFKRTLSAVHTQARLIGSPFPRQAKAQSIDTLRRRGVPCDLNARPRAL